MNSKKWIIQYLEVLLDIIVMFTSYLIANWYKFGFFRTGLINHTEHYLTLFLVELVAYVVVHCVAFADDNLINRKLFPEIYNVLKMYVYVGAITVGCVYFTKTKTIIVRIKNPYKQYSDGLIEVYPTIYQMNFGSNVIEKRYVENA